MYAFASRCRSNASCELQRSTRMKTFASACDWYNSKRSQPGSSRDNRVCSSNSERISATSRSSLTVTTTLLQIMADLVTIGDDAAVGRITLPFISCHGGLGVMLNELERHGRGAQ